MRFGAAIEYLEELRNLVDVGRCVVYSGAQGGDKSNHQTLDVELIVGIEESAPVR